MVGTSSATCLPECTARNAARIATSVFPNPTGGRWTLDFKNSITSPIKMVVSNARGQQVKTINLSAESIQEFDFSDLTNGVYFLQFTSARGNFVKKLIKI